VQNSYYKEPKKRPKATVLNSKTIPVVIFSSKHEVGIFYSGPVFFFKE
jgi:hypothetical protein